MNRPLPLMFLTSVLVLAPSLAAQTVYTIDSAASRVVVHVGKTGLFSFAGHTHEIAAPVASGTVTVDPADPARSSVRIDFDAAAFRVIGKGEPAADVPEVQRTMESERVLDVARFPRVTFASREIRVLGRDGDRVELNVAGDLTLHGTTRQESARVSATIAADHVTATGTLTVKQTDFGIEPVAAGAGTVRVKDEVGLDFTLIAQPARR
jgi:polyisoprenoid-binding protein YceI